MSQNKKPPAYMEYAANMLADINFRLMTLQDQGLLYRMRLECWANETLPGDINLLSRILGVSVDEIEASLPKVMPFFSRQEDYIFCPELENYRTRLREIRESQSKGGKKGSTITNKKRSKKNSAETSANTSDSEDTSISSSEMQVPRRVSDESLIQPKPNTTQPNPEKLIHIKDLSESKKNDFVKDYENHDIENPVWKEMEI